MGKHNNSLDEPKEQCHSYFLEPFLHQVGGHVGIFLWNAETICKPFTVREHDFYHFVPRILMSFVPAFKGVMEVTYDEHKTGYLLLRGKVPGCPSSSVPQATPQLRIRRNKNGGVNMVSSNESQEFVFQNFAVEEVNYCSNPWGLKCQSSHITRMLKSQSGNHRFLILENLVARLRRPCVLDLKLGTRQHGDDAPEEKRISQTWKCQKSTSASLGLRICGMQTYDEVKRVYRCTDKYRGRTFTPNTFKRELRHFLGSGIGDLAPIFLRKLEALHQTLLDVGEGFRFYSSSLLLLYDGDPVADGKSEADVRMIDFEHSTAVGFRNDSPHSGLDEGYLLGLRNLILTLKEFRDS